MAAPANGSTTCICSVPCHTAAAVPLTDTSAITASAVAWMPRMGTSVWRSMDGMMTKPPPTPSRPDRKPDSPPVAASTRAQGSVHRSRPSAGSSTHAGA
jgi:hypothetical protein